MMQNRLFDKRIAVGAGLLVSTWLSAAAADVAYEEKPATEPIVVTNGVHSLAGQKGAASRVCRWTFDDPETCLTDEISGYQLVSSSARQTNENVKVGAGAVTLTSSSYLKFSTIPEFLRGREPFTIMAWFYLPDTIGDKPKNAYFYAGTPGDSQAQSCIRCLLSNSQTTLAIGGHEASSVAIPSAAGRWMHVAVAYKPGTETQAATVTAYADSVSKTYTFSNQTGTTKESKQGLDLAASDAFHIGCAYWTTHGRHLGDNAALSCRIDQLQIFREALSEAEIARLRDETPPTDFAASWQMGAAGTLDLGASTNRQEVFGSTGVLTWSTNATATVGAETNRTFAGTVAGLGSLAVTNAAEATLTLSGTNTYVGNTTVLSGTLLIRPVLLPPGTLQDGLVGFWPFDDPNDLGRDYSTQGNSLRSTTNAITAVASENTAGGYAAYFPFAEATASRQVLSTPTVPNGISAPAPYGSSLTIAAWTRHDLPRGGKRAGFAAFNGLGTGFGYDSYSANTPLTFGNRDVGGAGSCKFPSATDWTKTYSYVLTYDMSLIGTANSNKVTKFYWNGDYMASTNSYKYNSRVGNTSFQVGGAIWNGNNSYRGAIDQVMLYNRALSAEEVTNLNAFGLSPVPTAATGVLPTGTTVDVKAGAAVAFENAWETVAGLTGAGAVKLAANSKLVVTGTFGLTGTAAAFGTGVGKLVLGSDLAFAPLASPMDVGEYEYATAPTGVIQMPDTTAGWTVVGLPRGRKAAFALRDNGDGTETLVAQVSKTGVILIVR